jgi:putative membrane protein
MNWKQKASCAAAGFLLLGLPALSQTGSSSSQTGSSSDDLNRYEAMVVWSIHQGNQNEIAMAKLAKDQSASKNVKDFADRLIQDHQSAEAQVQAYARSHKIDLAALGRQLVDMTQEQILLERRSRTVGSATGEWAWTWEHALRSDSDDRREMAKLRKLKGPDFDREFARAMVNDHQSMIDQLTDARARTTDSDLRSLIDKLLPTLQQHLSMAQKLQLVLSKA